MVCGSIPLGFSEPLRVQIEQGIETEQIQCNNDSHVLVKRTNGKLACVTEKTAEKAGWEIIHTIKKLKHIEGGLDYYSDIEITTNEITPNFITTTPSSESNSSETDEFGNVIGISEFGTSALPIYSLTYPDLVRLDEEFEVVINYSYISEEGLFEGIEPDEVCLRCTGMLGVLYNGDNITFNDDDFTHTGTYETSLVLPRLIRNTGEFKVEPSALMIEELVPQQKIIKMTIHEREIDFRIGGMVFYFLYSADDSVRLEYMINPDGTITLSHESIEVPAIPASQNAESLGVNSPENTIEISDDWDAYHYAEIPEEFSYAYDEYGNLWEDE